MRMRNNKSKKKIKILKNKKIAKVTKELKYRKVFSHYSIKRGINFVTIFLKWTKNVVIINKKRDKNSIKQI